MKKLFAILGASLVLGACTTTSSGTGTLGAAEQPVSLWDGGIRPDAPVSSFEPWPAARP